MRGTSQGGWDVSSEGGGPGWVVGEGGALQAWRPSCPDRAAAAAASLGGTGVGWVWRGRSLRLGHWAAYPVGRGPWLHELS